MGLRKLLEQAKTSGKINKCPMSDYDEEILFKILQDSYFDNMGFLVFDFRPYQRDSRVNLNNVEIFVDLYIQAQQLKKSYLLGSPRPHVLGKAKGFPSVKKFGLSDYWIEISCQDSRNLDIDVLSLIPQFIVGSQTFSNERFVITYDIYNFLIDIAEIKERRGENFLPMLRLFKTTAKNLSDIEENKHYDVITADEGIYNYLQRQAEEGETRKRRLRELPRFFQMQYAIGDYISRDNGIYTEVKKAFVDGKEVYVAPVEEPQAGDIIKGIMLGEDKYLNLVYGDEQRLFYEANKPLNKIEKKVLHLIDEETYSVLEKYQTRIDNSLNKLGMPSLLQQMTEAQKKLLISKNNDGIEGILSTNQKEKRLVPTPEVLNKSISKEIQNKLGLLMIGTELNGYFFNKE